jgi:hypothetical protein
VLVRGSTSTGHHSRAAAASLPPATAVCPRGLHGSELQGNLASIGEGHPPPSEVSTSLACFPPAAGQEDVVLDLGLRVSTSSQRGTSKTTRRSTPNWDRYWPPVAQLKAQEFACVGHGPSIFCFKPGPAASGHRFSPYIIANGEARAAARRRSPGSRDGWSAHGCS